MRWLVRESRLLSVLGCEELKLTARSTSLEGQTVASSLHRKPRTITHRQMNPPAASYWKEYKQQQRHLVSA